jgi:DNA mismatch repair protein MutS
VREQILDLDINNLTPVEALMKLNEIQKVVSGSNAKAKSERR